MDWDSVVRIILLMLLMISIPILILLWAGVILFIDDNFFAGAIQDICRKWGWKKKGWKFVK